MQNGHLGDDDSYKNFDFSFGYVLPSYHCTKFHCHQVTGEKLTVSKISNFCF